MKRVSVPLEEAAHRKGLEDVRRGVFLAAEDLERIGVELERVGEAVLGFRRSCAISELRRAKRHAAVLLAHCERVNANLIEPAAE